MLPDKNTAWLNHIQNRSLVQRKSKDTMSKELSHIEEVKPKYSDDSTPISPPAHSKRGATSSYDNTTEKKADVGGLLVDIVDLISDILDSIQELSLPGPTLKELEELQAKFDLWVDGVDVESGRLDAYIATSQEFSKPIFSICLTFLSSILPDDGSNFYKNTIQAHLRRLHMLVEKISFNYPDIEFETSEDSSSVKTPAVTKQESSEVTIDHEPKIIDFIEKFDMFQSQLSDLAPFLLELLVDCEEKNMNQITFLEFEDGKESSDGDKDNTHSPIPDLQPKDWYRNNIEAKFPDVDKRLSERLANEQWELYRNVKVLLQKRQEVEESKDTKKVVHISRATVVEHDSTYESMQHSLAASMIRPAAVKYEEIFDDIASNFSASSCQLKDRPRAPHPPDGVVLGVDEIFQCQFCLLQLRDVKTPRQWRKHVLSDVRPYICTFSDCKKASVRYRSKSEWMAHEVSDHRLEIEWRCNFVACSTVFSQEHSFISHLIDSHAALKSDVSSLRSIASSCKSATLSQPIFLCPLCSKTLPNKVPRLASHIGRHLEDLALSILAQLDERDDHEKGEESASDASQAYTDEKIVPPILKEDDPVLKYQYIQDRNRKMDHHSASNLTKQPNALVSHYFKLVRNHDLLLGGRYACPYAKAEPDINVSCWEISRRDLAGIREHIHKKHLKKPLPSEISKAKTWFDIFDYIAPDWGNGEKPSPFVEMVGMYHRIPIPATKQVTRNKAENPAESSNDTISRSSRNPESTLDDNIYLKNTRSLSPPSSPRLLSPPPPSEFCFPEWELEPSKIDEGNESSGLFEYTEHTTENSRTKRSSGLADNGSDTLDVDATYRVYDERPNANPRRKWDINFVCGGCKKRFDKQNDFHTHIKSCRNPDIEGTAVEAVKVALPASIVAGRGRETGTWTATRMRRTTTRSKEHFECSYCGAMFTSRERIMGHINRVHD